MPPGKPSFLIKPTLETLFHIDYDWWERSNDDLRPYLLTHLTAEQRERFVSSSEEQIFDYINPETGEVYQLDALGMAIQDAAKEDDFINEHLGLVDSVFRVFLANGNSPLTAVELEEKTGRDAPTILKTVGGMRVYKGIRPVITSS